MRKNEDKFIDDRILFNLNTIPNNEKDGAQHKYNSSPIIHKRLHQEHNP